MKRYFAIILIVILLFCGCAGGEPSLNGDELYPIICDELGFTTATNNPNWQLDNEWASQKGFPPDFAFVHDTKNPSKDNMVGIVIHPIEGDENEALEQRIASVMEGLLSRAEAFELEAGDYSCIGYRYSIGNETYSHVAANIFFVAKSNIVRLSVVAESEDVTLVDDIALQLITNFSFIEG